MILKPEWTVAEAWAAIQGSPDPAERARAVEWLGENGSAGEMICLQLAAQDDEPAVEQAAKKALRKLKKRIGAP